MAAAKKRGKNKAWLKLKRELDGLLEQVDEEGLGFLLRQARTIIHNLEVDRVNADVQKLKADTAGTARTEPVSAPPASVSVRVEEVGGGFVIDLGGRRKIFSREEMRALARVCQAVSDPREGARRLHTWFTRNRTDVFADFEIGGQGHPALVSLHQEIRGKFTPRT